MEELHLLCHQQRTELRGETLDEILVRVDRCPMRPPVRVVVELPEVDKLIDRAGIALEVADELLVLATPLERGVSEFLVEVRGRRRPARIGQQSMRTRISSRDLPRNFGRC